MKIKLLIFTLLLLGSKIQTTVLAGNIMFTSENIKIRLDGNLAVVEGDYTFYNPNPEMKLANTLVYPFPVTPELPFPDSIGVFTEYNQPLNFVESTKSILFRIQVNPAQTKKVTVKYWQPVPHNKFEYILTTTQKWGMPLKRATFTIDLNKELLMQNISYDSPEKVMNESYTTYVIDRENFCPDRNLIIEWEETD